jgi:hypothetical protein
VSKAILSQSGECQAIIGWAGSLEFYQKTVGATLIEDSEPGIFRGELVSE